MNRVLIISVLISFSVAAPTSEDMEAKILNYESKNDKQGNYEFSFATSNGIRRQESGRLVNTGQSDEHLEVQGVYSYTDSEGQLIEVHYWADDNGYHIESRPVQTYFPEPPLESGLPPAVVATLLG